MIDKSKTDISDLGDKLKTDISDLMKEIKDIKLQHDRRRAYRKRNKAAYEKWAKSRSRCEFCGKSYTNRNKSTHMKSRKCLKKQGKTVKPRKIRSDKGTKKISVSQ